MGGADSLMYVHSSKATILQQQAYYSSKLLLFVRVVGWQHRNREDESSQKYLGNMFFFVEDQMDWCTSSLTKILACCLSASAVGTFSTAVAGEWASEWLKGNFRAKFVFVHPRVCQDKNSIHVNRSQNRKFESLEGGEGIL